MPYSDKDLDGYMESLSDWLTGNEDAVEWALENHEAINAAMEMAEYFLGTRNLDREARHRLAELARTALHRK